MLYPVAKLLANLDPPTCAKEDDKVRDALVKMVENDFSQLPIVDGQGRLSGIISEQTIARTHFHIGEHVDVLDLDVQHCSEQPVTLTLESDLFEALDRLQAVYAIVIVEGSRPVGILTYYDTTHFFRELSAGLILVEDIEVTLRQFIEDAFPEEDALNQAMEISLGYLQKEEDAQEIDFSRLNFGDYLMIISRSDNWPEFEDYLGPKILFTHYMNQVRELRNQLAHFRGRPDALQYDILKRVQGWLSTRPRIHRTPEVDILVTEEVAVSETTVVGGKYAALNAWLAEQSTYASPGTLITVSMGDIEPLIKDSLPKSAREHRSWWANEPSSGRQSLAWMSAGWKVEDVDFNNGVISFRRADSVLYQLFFADILDRLKVSRPGLTRALKTLPQSWWSFSGGRSGFWFGWAFGRGGELRTELYIDTGDHDKNKQFFDTLYAEKDAIEEEFGNGLIWHRLDSRRASRIYSSRQAAVNEPPSDLELTKKWSLDTLMSLVDVFQPRIKKL
jgi:CBS domain-containing protein